MTSLTIQRRGVRMCGRFGHLPPLEWQRHTGWKSWTQESGESLCYICDRCGDIVDLLPRPRSTSTGNSNDPN